MIFKYWKAINNRLFLNAHAGDIGVGLVGVGGWGATNAAALMKTRLFDVKGVYDLNHSLSRRFAARYCTRSFDSFEKLLDQPDIIAIIITVPNLQHFDMVCKSAAMNKHVFIEKPLASTPKECQMLGQYCLEKQVVLFVGHQVRRRPVFREIKKFIQQGDLGKPLFAHGTRTIQHLADDWRRDPEACPGGSMEQLGIHLIDVMVYLFGTPKEWRGWSKNIPFRRMAPDWGHVAIHFADNISATVDSSFSSPNCFEFSLVCEKGQLKYDGKYLLVKRGDKWKRQIVSGPPGSITQFVEFANCVKGISTPTTNAETATIVLKVISGMVKMDKDIFE